jgi:predicted GNAT family N-acyltransferase
LYFWGLYAPDNYIKSIALVNEHIISGIYADCPKYARPKDAKAERLLKRVGWFPCDTQESLREQGILCHASMRKKAPKPKRFLSAKIANSHADLLKVFSIRAATYMAEQECPYDEEFDGNDFCSSHILGFVDGEPVACLRIRYFNAFVKLERLAVRKEYRGSGITALTIEKGLDYAKRKGFTKFYGHSRSDLIKFWARFGFHPIQNRPPLSFSNQDYVEIFYESEAHPDPISLDDGPYVIIRPEGAWERPGVLDPIQPTPSLTSGSEGAHLGQKELPSMPKSPANKWKLDYARANTNEHHGNR